MIKDTEIEKTLDRLNELPEDTFIDDYKKLLEAQMDLFGFFVETSNQFQLTEECKNSATELIYNVLSVYKDAFKERYPIVKEETIMSVLKERNELEKEQAVILGVDVEDENAGEKAQFMLEKVNEAILNKETGKLEGNLKRLFEFIQAQNEMINEKHLMDYIVYYIDNDELIVEEDKPMIGMIMETFLLSLDKELKNS